MSRRNPREKNLDVAGKEISRPVNFIRLFLKTIFVESLATRLAMAQRCPKGAPKMA